MTESKNNEILLNSKNYFNKENFAKYRYKDQFFQNSVLKIKQIIDDKIYLTRKIYLILYLFYTPFIFNNGKRGPTHKIHRETKVQTEFCKI